MNDDNRRPARFGGILLPGIFAAVGLLLFAVALSLYLSPPAPRSPEQSATAGTPTANAFVAPVRPPTEPANPELAAKLAKAARARQTSDGRQALLLASEALVAARSSEALTVFIEALQRSNLLDGRFIQKPSDHRLTAAASPDGRNFAFGNLDHTVTLYDLTTGKPRLKLSGAHSDAIGLLDFSADGLILTSVDYERNVALWEVSSGRLITKLAKVNSTRVQSFAYHLPSKTFASSSCLVITDSGDCNKSETIIWDLATGKPKSVPLEGYYGFIHAMAFTPDGKSLVTGHSDGSLLFWDVASGLPAQTPLRTSSYAINAMLFTADGKTLISANTDNVIIFWNTENRQVSKILNGHGASVNSISLSADEKLLASASSDRTVRLWDTATGQPIGNPLTGQTDRVMYVAFSPDSRALVSANIDTNIVIWNFNIETWREAVCSAAGRNLTQGEWQAAAPGEPYRKTCKNFS
jgi:WD40 repeat protein